LLQALLEVKPHVVHFSGHGSPSAKLILLDDRGKPKPVSQKALVHLFRTLKDNVRVVVLNACSSRPQAKAIAATIDCCTVGMNRPIGDKAAIVFAASFYRAIGFGCSIKEAFEQGKTALLLEGIPEDQTPELLTRPGVDAAGFRLIAPPPVAGPGVETPAAKGSGGPMSSLAHLALVRELSGLDPADWATLVAAIPGAGSHISRHGTVAEHVEELVRWAASSRGPGLRTVEEVARSLRNPP
jgi:hypothetical protein